MRVLVTGGAGFIGSHVAEALLAAGHEVLVLDDLSAGDRGNVPAEARFVQLDDRAGVLRTVEAFRPEAVNHHAAQTNLRFSVENPIADGRANVLGTLHLLEAALAAGAGRFLYASTGGAIYGQPTRDYVFVGDVVRANLLATEKAPPGACYNVGTGKPATDQRIFDLVRAAIGAKVTAIYDKKRPGEVDHIYLDCSRVERGLGWRAQVPLEEGIERAVAFYRTRAGHK